MSQKHEKWPKFDKKVHFFWKNLQKIAKKFNKKYTKMGHFWHPILV